MGVYPINAIRHAAQLEPVAVRGRQWSEREEMYSDVDEFTDFELRFEKGLVATGETSLAIPPITWMWNVKMAGTA
jgi:glucose-fructose oxidoreductase